MRREAESILADAGEAAEPALRARAFLALAAASFSLAHVARDVEHARIADAGLAACEQAIAAARTGSPGQAELVAELLALLAAVAPALDETRRRRVHTDLESLAVLLTRLVPDASARAEVMRGAIKQADTALSSLLRCTCNPTVIDALGALEV